MTYTECVCSEGIEIIRFDEIWFIFFCHVNLARFIIYDFCVKSLRKSSLICSTPFFLTTLVFVERCHLRT